MSLIKPMRLKADLLLLLVTVIWGTAFVAMRMAAGHGTIFYLNGIRFLLGGLLLLPFVKIRKAYTLRNLVYVGLAGLALFGGVTFQQAGLAMTTAGNGGFLTSLYVVIVPFLLWVFWHEKPGLRLGFSALLAVAGGFLLSTKGTMALNGGDVLVFIGSFFWALHVIVVGKGQAHIDPLPFALGQFIVCGLVSTIIGAFIERPAMAELVSVLPAVLYTGIFSIAVGFTFQVIAQKHTPSVDAAIILSLEAVFAALFGWLILGESLEPIQLLGCGAILLAVVLVQFKGKIIAA